MANRAWVIALALVALTVALPAFSGAQSWAQQNINGLAVYDRAGAGWRERAVEVLYGWYYEVSFFDARGSLTGMRFTLSQWQASDRVDYVGDTNGDRVMDTGWQYFIERGWIPWAPTEIVSYRTLSNQARSKYTASIGTPQQELHRMYVTRADKMLEAADRSLKERGKEIPL